MQETIKIHSSVTTNVLRRALFRGVALAGLGIALIFYAGIFIPPEQLRYWGPILVCIAIALVAWGLIPHRQLTRLQLHPYEIGIDDKSLSFSSQGKKQFTVERQSVDKMEFRPDDYEYGIALWLKDPLPEMICVHNHSFKMESFQNRSKSRHFCDLFFPYFSHKDMTEIQEVWASEELES